MDERELLTTQRIGLVAWVLSEGGTVTVHDVARLINITPNGSWRLLSKLSTVIPLVNDSGGHWYVIRDR